MAIEFQQPSTDALNGLQDNSRISEIQGATPGTKGSSSATSSSGSTTNNSTNTSNNSTSTSTSKSTNTSTKSTGTSASNKSRSSSNASQSTTSKAKTDTSKSTNYSGGSYDSNSSANEGIAPTVKGTGTPTPTTKTELSHTPLPSYKKDEDLGSFLIGMLLGLAFCVFLVKLLIKSHAQSRLKSVQIHR